ncbi:phage holin family protein [Streptomyces sp. DW26H14]|uniref:phage holin family protein n=1 Tax=Streptomyces sp. DW26H14 TaxID=3435395 RepID=UPI00403DC579
MQRGRWRTAGRALLRVLTVWAVSTLTMLALAGLLPDFRLQAPDGDSATRTALTAAWGAGAFGLLSALVWPLLVRAFLLVPALLLGLLVFFLNGSLLLVALRLIPDGRGDVGPETAVVVAAVMSAVASATSTALAAGDESAHPRRLSRAAGRRRRRNGEDGGAGGPYGTVFVQLDGVGHQVLVEALAAGLLPHIAERLGDEGTHRLTRWRTDWSSQTGASQLAILHGTNHDVPAFRWYEKDSGRTIVSNRPASAAELQRRAVGRTGDGGLLTLDGASRGNLFSGGADQLALVLSMAARRGRSNRSRAGYFAYFRDPANAVRTAVSFAVEVAREIAQSTRARLRHESPRVGRGGLYPLIRAFATVVERDVVVAAVMADILSGRSAVYADFVAYDEVAHHSGPRSHDALRVLARLDRCVGAIARATTYAPRAYHLVLLSDHGQSPGETFEGAYGLTLRDLVRAGCGLPVPRRAERTRSGAEARFAARHAVRAVLHRPVHEGTTEEGAATGPGPVVLASGNLGLVSFPDVPGRMTREQIDRRHPALLRTLAHHPGIGFLLVAREHGGSLVLGRDGAEVPVAALVDGEGPLAGFPPGAAAAIRRTDGFPHVADIMVNSMYEPETGRVHAFEEQIGSHGGLGGEQSHAFLMSPHALSPAVPGGTVDGESAAAGAPAGGEGAELVGAEEVHRVLRRWLRECVGPQVPLPAVLPVATAIPGPRTGGGGGAAGDGHAPAPERPGDRAAAVDADAEDETRTA